MECPSADLKALLPKRKRTDRQQTLTLTLSGTLAGNQCLEETQELDITGQVLNKKSEQKIARRAFWGVSKTAQQVKVIAIEPQKNHMVEERTDSHTLSST